MHEARETKPVWAMPFKTEKDESQTMHGIA